MPQLDDDAYTRLLGLRTGLRRFERWSAQQAEAAGLTAAQHQLLLAIRGHGDDPAPTVGDVADYLLLQHHSTVGLIDRAEAADLVERVRDEEDHRIVRLRLTATGAERLAALSALHLEELDRLALEIPEVWRGLGTDRRPHGFGGSRPSRPRLANRIEVARVHDPPAPVGRQHRVLVDRLWPRGISKSAPPWDAWVKDVAPSTELRRWYGHDPQRFEEFTRRYRQELSQPPRLDALHQLESAARQRPLLLMTATREANRSGAAVLAAVLTEDRGSAER